MNRRNYYKKGLPVQILLEVLTMGWQTNVKMLEQLVSLKQQDMCELFVECLLIATINFKGNINMEN